MDLSRYPDISSVALAAIDEAVLVIGPDPRTVVACNDAAERLFGWSTEELCGQTTRMLHIDDDHYQEFARRGEDELRRTGSFRTTFRMRRRDGTTFDSLHTVVLLSRARGLPAGAVSIIRDVSESQRLKARLRGAEERVVRAQRLEVAGRLAASMTHDLNNYLTVVATHADWLASAEPGSEQHGVGLEIGASVDRIVALSERILAFVRQEQPGEHPTVALDATIRGCERLLRSALGGRTTLELDLASEPDRVRIDAGGVEQIALNLAINAREAMPEGGRLSIRTHTVDPGAPELGELGWSGPGSGVLWTVVDTGAGMSREVRARAFEPFFTTRPDDGGTGLGLSAVRELVQRAGGDIRLDSTPGEGTTFRILLPVVDDDSDQPATGAKATTL